MNCGRQLEKQEIETQDYAAEFYENKRYARTYSLAYHSWWAKKMFSCLDLKSPILDNGCGNGFLAQFLKGYEVVGLDISPKMAAFAENRYSKVVLGNAQKLPFSDSYFQVVINRSLLHHLSDPVKAVSEIQRVLKPGGQAVFTETLCSSISALPRILLRRGKHFSSSHKNFSEKELRKIIGSELKIEKVFYFGYLAYFLLGFPDIFDIYKFFPAKKFFTPFFIKFDEIIAKIPFLNRHLAWSILILARKEKKGLD